MPTDAGLLRFGAARRFSVLGAFLRLNRPLRPRDPKGDFVQEGLLGRQDLCFKERQVR